MSPRRTLPLVPAGVAAGGLAVLVATQLTLVRSDVEQDLAARSTAALHRAGIVDIGVSVIGRDVHLTGAARTDTEAATAVRVVKAERGVRVVIADLHLRGSEASPSAPAPSATALPTPVVTAPAVTATPHPTSSAPASTTAETSASPSATPSASPSASPSPTPSPGTGKPDAREVAAHVQRQLTALPKLEFASRMSTLLPRSRASVLRAARILKANPGVRIRIEGYTDNLGGARVNRELSAGRAEVVRLTLIHMGVAANRLQVAWFGESRPLVPNTSATYRARNRRVELVVLP